MPKVYLCSFATDDFKNSQEILKHSALTTGKVDYFIGYGSKKKM